MPIQIPQSIASKIQSTIQNIKAGIQRVASGISALKAQKASTSPTPSAVSGSSLPAFSTPTITTSSSSPAFSLITPEKQQQIQEIQKQIAEINKQIEARQKVLTEARAAGITSGVIPAEIFEKAGVEPTLSVPTKTADLKSTDKIADITDVFLKEMERTKQQREEFEKAQLETLKKLTETERPDILAERQRLEAQLKVPEQYEQLIAITTETQSLRKRIAEREAAFQRGMLQIEQQPVAMTIITGEQAALQRQWAIEKSALAAELGAKVATAEMIKGNISLARSLISDTISALTYDTRQKIEDMRWLFDQYGDYVKTLDTRTQNNLRNALSLLEDKLEIERKEKNEVLDLMLKYNPYGTDIKVTDSLEEAVKKASEIKLPTTTKTDAERINTLNQFINQRRGTDGKISAETYVQAQQQWLQMGGTITDFKNYYLPSTLMTESEIRKLPPEMQTTAIAGAGDWDLADNYIQNNIQAGATSPSDLSAIYSNIKANTRLSDSDIKAKMAEYGIVQIGGLWTYMGTGLPEETIEKPKEQPWWRKAFSEIWHRLPFIK